MMVRSSTTQQESSRAIARLLLQQQQQKRRAVEGGRRSQREQERKPHVQLNAQTNEQKKQVRRRYPRFFGLCSSHLHLLLSIFYFHIITHRITSRSQRLFLYANVLDLSPTRNPCSLIEVFSIVSPLVKNNIISYFFFKVRRRPKKQKAQDVIIFDIPHDS